MTFPARIEIAVTTLQDARSAQAGGAHSIELSQDLTVGGLTPPLGLISEVRAAVAIDMHVIIRPHARDFVYTSAEIDTILEQTEQISSLGINGIVFGAQTPAGNLDIDLIRRVVDAASALPVTVHRALDDSPEPEAALAQLVGLVPRVLTSGPAANAWEGREGLRRWVRAYGQHFSFVAAGGLRLDQLAAYAAFVGAGEYHFGRAARTNGHVDAVRVRQLREIVAGL
jgi:copper homeostasis protein